MATVKRNNVPPTHPTVWLGLGLAVIGLLLAVYSYTGARVYNVTFAIVALVGAFLALAGILVAAWGRSIMSARASRARRANFQEDALSLARPVAATSGGSETLSSEDVPTVASSREKKRFGFGGAKRTEKREAAPQGVFAFKRQAPKPEPERAQDDPRNPDVAARLDPDPLPVMPAASEASEDQDAPQRVVIVPQPEPMPHRTEQPVRVTLRCPQCSSTFAAEGVRPFTAVCASCGFRADI